MNKAYLLTGGNIGDRLTYLLSAYQIIEKSVGEVLKKSSIYETEAWGLTNQNAFLNQVLLISTNLSAEELLEGVLNIEQQLGRKRFEKMGPRTIDIDIIFYNDDIIASPHLTIPHPRIAERRFVLTPISEIAPDFVHPVLKKTITQLLEICPDQLEVKKYIGGNQ